jgi:hypothetical protein
VRLGSAEPADAAGIAVVHVRTWRDAYRWLMPQDYLDDDAGAAVGEVTSLYVPAGWAVDGAERRDERDGFTLREVRYRVGRARADSAD